MFISFSKVLGKSKFRLGAGFRVTKKNAAYMLFFLLFYWMLMLCFYMIAFCIWLVYAMGYGVYWCIKKILKR
jgi:hypothetical protein